MQRDMQAILDGAAAGAIGTAGMSAWMLAAGRLGIMGEQPPDKIAGAALDAAGAHGRNEETQDALASALHFAFGIGSGALFAALHRRLPFKVPAAFHGMLFGCLVWVTSYQGWLPALGIMPPASRDRPGRQPAMFVAHLIYGALLGAAVGRRGQVTSEK